ncbi:MAG TPA: FMN-binding protein [Trebonia sp.]|jgi:uncharacterized protein with FMN-binding domain|nr:FMN-binding protein [Trebonia sp.]
MRRAVLTLGGTLAGVAALLSFKTHPGTSADAAASPVVPAAPASAHASGKPTVQPAAKSGGGMGDSTTARVLTGQVISTQYGPMQVQITLSGQKITAAKVLQQTDTGTNSQQIDANAIPKLTSETLAAQSARIDAVSGASYTSSGYVQSLQSALDKA